MRGLSYATRPPHLNMEWSPEPAIVAAGYLRAAQRIRSTGVPLEDAARYMSESTRRKFDEEGPGWEPLSEATIQIRGSSSPILNRDGTLKRVATRYNIWSVDGNRGIAFVRGLSGAEYGSYHQTGTSNMPARPFLTFTAEDEAAIENIFDEWLEQRISDWESGIRGPRQPHWRFRGRFPV